MEKANHKTSWDEYCKTELAFFDSILKQHGYSLEEEQPHLGGERYLMQAITTESGKKLILLGNSKDGRRVVIKATRENGGKRELRHERTCRSVLKEINFAYEAFHTPEEIDFIEKEKSVISIQEFIEQQTTFLKRPLREQFDFALAAFKAQEGTHATTYTHLKTVQKTFGMKKTEDYIRAFGDFVQNIDSALNEPEIKNTLDEAHKTLLNKHKTVSQYGDFLTHTDFVPHNFRISDGTMYLLDYSSLCFGNKYEGWARFLNFMALYNPELEKALTEYVKLNRSDGEQESLHLMRIYRLGEIMWYYTNSLEECEGDLKKLNQERIHFWFEVLKATHSHTQVSKSIIENYKKRRDSLRSEEEKTRQIGLH